MAYTTINKSSLHMNTKLISGNGGTQNIAGLDFKPDFTWIKSRSRVDPHSLTDIVRGVASQLDSSGTGVPTTHSDAITSFNSDGFSLGSQADVNRSGTTFASWNWKAGGGQGSSNTDGSINTIYTSVNTTSGFSISKYTGTGSAGATVGHGLGVAPKMIIVKGLTYADVWIVGGDNLGGWNKEMYLNSTGAVATNNNAFNGVAPTSSVFTLGSGNGTNKSGDTYIAYCFAEKTGYSKFGSYTGNGNADGTFVYTGFAPSWVMEKRTADSGWNWYINDNVRKTFNVNSTSLFADNSNAETSDGMYIDMLSNGFKLRETGNATNANGQPMIYMAFGQSLVGSNNVPCTAR